MEDKDLQELISGLNFKEIQQETYEVRYGEAGRTFYIILQGKCSVWVPANDQMMLSVIDQWLESHHTL